MANTATKSRAQSLINYWPKVALLAIVSVLAFGCGLRSHPVKGGRKEITIRVAAASDLKFALDELILAFAKDNPGVVVEPSYGSSGNFYSQLSNQAPFDLFLSADRDYPRKLIDAGLADATSEFIYGVGRIVVWTTKARNLDVQTLGIAALQAPGVQKIAIANPAHAPYGRAAEAALKSLGVYDSVNDRLVLGENISQTAQFVESGAADIGVIALSLALAPKMESAGQYWVVPEDAYPKMEQVGVILTRTTERSSTEALRAFIISTPGREILKRYGFQVPEE